MTSIDTSLNLSQREVRVLRSALGEDMNRLDRFMKRPLRGWRGALTVVTFLAILVAFGLPLVLLRQSPLAPLFESTTLLFVISLVLYFVSLYRQGNQNEVIKKLYTGLEAARRSAGAGAP